MYKNTQLIGKKINIIKSWTSKIGFNFKQVKKLVMGFRKNLAFAEGLKVIILVYVYARTLSVI